MRRNQLSFTIESFLDQAKDGERHLVKGYIDGNSAAKITRDFIYIIHSIYAQNDMSIEDFIKEVLKNDDTFGRCEVTLKDNSGNVENISNS